MENNNYLSRIFAEAIFRLKRDSINFKLLKIDKTLKLRIGMKDNNNAIITFDVNSHLWKLNQNGEEIENWNPKISEFVDFLKPFTEQEILDDIYYMDIFAQDELMKCTSILLKPKFVKIMEMLKLPENNYVKIVMGSVIISYDMESEKFINDWVDGSKSEFTEQQIDDLLNIFPFPLTMKSLNTTYSNLKTKK